MMCVGEKERYLPRFLLSSSQNAVAPAINHSTSSVVHFELQLSATKIETIPVSELLCGTTGCSSSFPGKAAQ